MASNVIPLDKPRPPERVTLDTSVQTSAHAINTLGTKLATSVGRAWTTEPQIEAATADCLEILVRTASLLRLLKKGGG